ncbi:MAG TPA: error-prone DNA polymerase [Burkholderiaceae bacterium]|nr:error-prone DNA polymerase [Burkholderiaceae bacterium]
MPTAVSRGPRLPGYAELHCRSNFSFLTGASHPAELVERAKALGYAALAITDECSVAGVVRAHVAARETGLPLIVGAEMRLTLPPAGDVKTQPQTPHARLVLLAQTRRGYGNLSHWITIARRRAPKGSYLAHPGDIEGKVPNAPTLAGLPECLALLAPEASQPFETVFAHAVWLKTWFRDRAALAISLLRRPGDDELVEVVRRVAQVTGLPIVAAGDVLMHVRSRKPLQDVLGATRLKRPVAECGLGLESNAEQHLRSRTRLARLYEPVWLENTLALAGRCSFSLSELKYEYPREVVPEGCTPIGHLRALAHAGLADRFPDRAVADRWLPQIEKELALIEQLKYEAYFLTVADIVRWARAQKILCQGRGSAANSMVCYCLGVTEVNPEEATLLFERFVSAERNEPPDIDIDFEHQRREEVIQYIYGKYGRHRTALTAVVICYRARSALRDVGRALGMDLQRIELLTKSMHWWDDSPQAPAAPPPEGSEPGLGRPGAGFGGRNIDTDRLRDAGFEPQAPLTRLWIALTQQLINFPRHLSQHPGGFVIAREQIEQLVPVENAAMEDRSVVQWDKDDLDELRLIKVDILALGMLSALRRALEFIGAKLGRELRMQDVPREEPATYDMICQADTVGTFQIESRAQMSMLPRLKPRTYYDLVVEVAIVRPGPIQGGMVHPYLKNRALEDHQIDYPAALRPALQRTKGVPIFQEQVMQIAMIAAEYTPGEADALRRSMAAWKRKGGLGHHHDRLVGRMIDKGYDPEFAERIFKQIEGFGEYGFPESHAAGFAQLAYASCWIKRHHPDAFLAALLNSQPMGFYAPAQLVRDARAHGVQVRPVDVTASGVESTLEAGAASSGVAAPTPPLPLQGTPLHPVRLGLDRIGGLSAAAAQRIVAARAVAAFDGIEDLARRAALNAHELQCLAGADALRALTGHRHQAAWAVAGIDTRATALLRASGVVEATVVRPAPAEAEETLADYRALGLTLGRHPVALLREQLAAFRVQPAAVLRTYPNGRLARASGIVTHRQRPETAKGTMFVTLEDDTGSVNAIVWPAVVETQRRPLLAARLLTLFGRWQRQEGSAGDADDGAVMHLVVMKAIDHTALLQGLASRSRDFR